MATMNRSIFRQRAIEKYARRQELQVVLRLVSPPMFKFLWALLILSVGAGVLVSFIQEPVVVQGKGIVVQQKASGTTNANTQNIVVLLLLPSDLPSDQQAKLKAGLPVTVNIASTNISFTSTVASVQGVMSPADIGSQLNLSLPVAQTISSPYFVATAQVVPVSQAKTYLGSQCQAQVQIGSESALSLVPGYDNLSTIFNIIVQNVKNLPNLLK